jgi:ribonuclease H / adenosylcobalamin/alpha-ribazole phosphatase
MRLIIHADGGCWPNPGQSFCGVVVRDDRGVLLENIRRDLGMGTNNTAEWNALIAALEAACHREATRVEICMDSNLVVQGINGKWRVKDAKLKPLFQQALTLKAALLAAGCAVDVRWVPREQNKEADALTEQRVS